MGIGTVRSEQLKHYVLGMPTFLEHSDVQLQALGFFNLDGPDVIGLVSFS
jgi:hypothetical protein